MTKRLPQLVLVFAVFAGYTSLFGGDAGSCTQTINEWPEGPSYAIESVDGLLWYGSGSMLRVAALPNLTTDYVDFDLGYVISWIDASDDYVLVAAGKAGLFVFERANDFPDNYYTRIDTSGSCRAGVVSGDNIFIADGHQGLKVFDFSDPSRPHRIGSFPSQGIVTDLAIHESTLYLLDYFGMYFLNVSDPTEPEEISFSYALAGYRFELEWPISYLTKVGTLYTVDLSDPHLPVILDTMGSHGAIRDLQYDAPFVYAVKAFYSSTSTDPKGLVVFDCSDPADIQEHSGYAVGRRAFSVTVSGGVAYVADVEYGISLVDLGQSGSARTVFSIETPGQASEVVLNGQHAFVADGQSGMLIVDVFPPSRPSIVGSFPTFGEVVDLDADGDMAYLIDSELGFIVVDCSDVRNPEAIGELNLPDGMALSISGSMALFVDPFSLHVIDISDPKSPVSISSIPIDGGALGLSSNAEYAFVASTTGLNIIDVSDPAAPETTAVFYGPHMRDVAVSVDGNTAFIAARYHGVYVIDVTDKRNPGLLWSDDYGGDPVQVSTAGNQAFFTTGRELAVFDFSNPWAPVLLEEVVGDFDGAASAGNFAVTVGGSFGLEILDLSGTWKRRVSSSLTLPGNTLDAAFDEDTVYVADAYRGIQVLRLSESGTYEAIGAVDVPGTVGSIDVAPPLAVVSASSSGVRIIDISRAEQPFEVGSFYPGHPHSNNSMDVRTEVVRIVDDLVIAGAVGLHFIDISAPNHPVEVGLFADGLWRVRDLEIVGDRVYIAASPGLRVVDFSDPSEPVETFAYEIPSPYAPISIAVEGTLALLLGPYASVHAFDISDPDDVRYLTTFEPAPDFQYASDIEVTGNFLFIGLGSSGLLVLNIQDIFQPTQVAQLSDLSVGGLLRTTDGIAVLEGMQGFTRLSINDICSERIFADSFETGALSPWTDAFP